MVPINHSASAPLPSAVMPPEPVADAYLNDDDRAHVQDFKAISEGLVDLRANGIGDTVKLIFGRPHDVQRVPARFADDMANRQLPNALTRDRLNLPQLRLLAALYTGLLQGNAFCANGAFDIDGLVSFVSHYLAKSPDWVTNCLESEAGQRHFIGMKRWGPAENADHASRSPSICDSMGGEIRVPVPMSALFVSGEKYEKLHLVNMSLQGAELTDVHITDSNLSGVNFSLVVFKQVAFKHCRLDSAFFDRASLTAVDMDGTHAPRANFTQCDIHGGKWTNSHFKQAGFHSTEIEGLTSLDCSFREARFTGPSRPGGRPWPALFKNVTFLMSHLNKATFSSLVATGLTIDASTCHGATFSDNEFSASRFTVIATEAIFLRNEFRSSSLSGIDANGSKWLEDAFDEDCAFTHADLSNSTLRRVTFNSVAFHNVNFSGATLRDTHFTGTRGPGSFVRADFNDAALHGVIFRQCRFTRSQFLNVHMTESQFNGCDLQGAHFRGATGVDVVSAEAGNIVAGLSFTGVRGAFATWALDDLETAEGRSCRLNRRAHADCMLAQIMGIADLTIRADWVLAIASHLNLKVAGEMDADGWMLGAMLTLAEHPDAPLLEARVLLEQHIHMLLLRQIGGLNRAGFHSDENAEWALLAAGRIGAMLTSTMGGAHWQKMSPLIAAIFALHDKQLVRLDERTLARLHYMRIANVPPALAQAAQAVVGSSVLEPVHPLFLTPDGMRALFVHPDAIYDFLGITENPLDISVSCMSFTATANGWLRNGRVEGDDLTDMGNAALVDTIRCFPMLSRSQASKLEMLNELIRALAFAPELRQIFMAGLLRNQLHDLTRAPRQASLTHAFARLTEASGAMHGTERVLMSDEQRRAAALRPTASHQAAVWHALWPLREPGAFYPEAALCFGLACLFYRAASAEMFGKPLKSPGGLRNYALAWVNLGFDLCPVLADRLAPLMQYHHLVNRSIGYGAPPTCAAEMAESVRVILRLPLWGLDPNMSQIWATFCE